VGSEMCIRDKVDSHRYNKELVKEVYLVKNKKTKQ